MELWREELYHHGIRGQEWGVRNGPPYPLGGGDYSTQEMKAIRRQRLKKNSIYNKKHFDQVIEKGKQLKTLSYDQNRTKNADMFYAAYKTRDANYYNAFFNKKVPQPVYDDSGNVIGTESAYKYRIQNKAQNRISVASEDSGIKEMLKLYKNDRDFYNFVRDPDRMESHFVEDKYKFKGYRQAKDALERVRSSDVPSENDLRQVYRMFNCIIPSDAGGKRGASDVTNQRVKFFNSLKKSGYGAVLDTNDAIYGGFKRQAPVIVFDMSQIAFDGVDRVSTSSHRCATLASIGQKVLGL